MATVTMTGKEYEEILSEIHQLESKVAACEQWLKKCVQITFPDDSFNSWGAGRMPGPCNEIPEWMRDTMLREIARQLMCQEDPVLKKLEAGGIHKYAPFDTSLCTYGGFDVLPHFKGLDKVWEHAHLDNEADKEAEKEDNDEQDAYTIQL